jgi:phosphoglycolate phosphatase-like HAD superfamily hydrolase
MSQTKLPSWRPGSTRDAIEAFLDAAEMLPVEQRVAVFDNDGTLWCERPQVIQIGFLERELREAVDAKPALAERAEYRAVLDGDRNAIAQLGPVNVVLALAELHTGLTPEAFETRVRAYFAVARHPDRDVPLSQTRYRPMLELIGELRARHFSVHIATGSGTEFMRAISESFYGVAPAGVVGSQVGYELVHEQGRPILRRTREVFGDPNEGPAKIANIQRLIGRRPILAVGNSRADAEMLEYTAASEGPALALLLDHDDDSREYAYQGVAGSVTATETMIDMAGRMDWSVISMRRDWSTVYADS